MFFIINYTLKYVLTPRDDLIAYYEELGEVAMHRERVALWRVRRAQLSLAREEFIEAERQRWVSEMEEVRQGQVRNGGVRVRVRVTLV